ncbi:MAG: hypothetical protein RJA57_254 [Bacteroidota bacterium]|jgi:hypothetical protein
MYPVLYDYLLLHQRLCLPGMGTLVMDRRSARSDFAARAFRPPQYVLEFHAETSEPEESFFSWLALQLDIPAGDAADRFHSFADELRSQLDRGVTIQWSRVGTLRKALNGTYHLAPVEVIHGMDDVVAEKVLREKATHSVRVGESERTSGEMEVLLSRPHRRVSYAGILYLLLILLSGAFVAWHFWRHDLAPHATGNTIRRAPQGSPQTHTQLP